MNLGSIYNYTTFLVYGNTPPPAEVSTYWQALEGVITNVHRNIQRANDYWFMEGVHAWWMVAGTPDYPLPADFKKEVYLEFEDITIPSTYHERLIKLSASEYLDKFKDDTASAWVDYPEHYSIVWDAGGEIGLGPAPKTTGVILWMIYYRYLQVTAPFAAYEDALTIEAPYLIANMAAIELEKKLQNDPQKIAMLTENAQSELNLLKEVHKQKMFANYDYLLPREF
jgi:hypothetical protein